MAYIKNATRNHEKGLENDILANTSRAGGRGLLKDLPTHCPSAPHHRTHPPFVSPDFMTISYDLIQFQLFGSVLEKSCTFSFNKIQAKKIYHYKLCGALVEWAPILAINIAQRRSS